MSLKIIQFTGENIKRLKAVQITPKGNLVTIAGKNRQGKTSILDAIWYALAGAKNIQDDPIRHGEDHAEIVLKIGSGPAAIKYVLTREFDRTAPGSKNQFTTELKLETAAGATIKKPQQILDDLIGAISFDPLMFARSDKKTQFNTLRPFVAYNFEAHDIDHDADYANRTDINREVLRLKSEAAGIEIPDEAPDRIDTADLLQKMQQAGERNSRNAQLRTRRASMLATIESKKAEIARIQAEISDYEDQVSAIPKELEDIDVSEMRQRIQSANDTNAKADLVDRHAALMEDAQIQKARSDALTARIDAREAKKNAAIAAAKMPVPGLGFGQGFITLNGVPFEQGSDAEQLRASIAIAMAMNPELRVIRVRDGSLLDEDSMKMLEQMCEEHDFQCWLEKVSSDEPSGFIIEDGLVARQPVTK